MAIVFYKDNRGGEKIERRIVVEQKSENRAVQGGSLLKKFRLLGLISSFKTN